MSTALIGSFPLGVINVGLNGAVTAIVPLLAQFDFMVTGPFGLGALIADLSAQLNAALAAQISLGLHIINPFAALKAQLLAILQIQASIAATIALGLPAVSASLSVSLSGSIAIGAVLAIRVGGLHLLIKAALAVKLPVVNLLANFNLSAGPFVLLSIGFAGPSTLFSSGNEYKALTTAALGGINPGDQVWGVVMLTKVPSASVALSGIIKTS